MTDYYLCTNCGKRHEPERNLRYCPDCGHPLVAREIGPTRQSAAPAPQRLQQKPEVVGDGFLSFVAAIIMLGGIALIFLGTIGAAVVYGLLEPMGGPLAWLVASAVLVVGGLAGVGALALAELIRVFISLYQHVVFISEK